MTYQWSVSPANTFAATVVDELNAFLSLAGSVVAISNTTLLPSDAVFVFQLRVSNFMGGASSTLANVTIASEPLPEVSILGTSMRSFRRSQEISLKVMGARSVCASSTDGRALSYSWNLTRVSFDPATVESGYINPFVTVGSYVTNDPSVLKIPAGTLQSGGVYAIEAKAFMADRPEVQNVATVAVTIVPDGVTAVIAGGNRLVGSSVDLVLNSGSSADLDGTTAVPFLYNWTCTVLEDNSLCNTTSGALLFSGGFLSQTGSILTIAAGTLSAGQYVFQMTASKGSAGRLFPNSFRSATTSVTITIVGGTPPVVSAYSDAALKINPDTRVSLFGSATSSNPNPLTLKWSVVGASDAFAAAVFGTTATRASAIARRNSLTAGVSYTFRFSATDSDRQTAFAEVAVVVNSPPSSGYVAVSPSNGTSLTTQFTVSAPLWTDDATDLPLMFLFGYYAGNASDGSADVKLSGSPDISSFVEKLLPQGSGANNTLTLVVYVTDNFGASIRTSRGLDNLPVTVSVSPFVFSSGTNSSGALDELSNKSAVLLQSALDSGDTSALLSNLIVLSSVISQATDPCKSVSCGGHGECVAGVCVCQAE
jgi:hypothetical protein